MFKWFLFLMALVPACCFGQINISGTISDALSNKPLPSASVFLSNATIGDRSDADGRFKLKRVPPGKYELVVTIVGYEQYHQNIIVENKDIDLPEIKLISKTLLLKEVTVMPNKDWEMYYAIFKKEFLGESAIAKQCKIKNPDVIDLAYDKNTRTLSASSSDFIEIENKALGYKMKYLLTKFVKDNSKGWLYFEGSALYEPSNGSESQQRKWMRARKDAYEGSTMHFLRSVISNTVAENGFIAMRLIRKPNPAYRPGSLVDRYLQTLVNSPLKANDYTSLTDRKGTFAIKFDNCLYVMYTKRKDISSDVYKTLDMPNYQTSIASFGDDYPLFDCNGIIENPATVTFEGYWGTARVAEMLPVDYKP
ncbi:carboxypeptidase-like regulatory domain-containing protein [Mucilaginibacter sp. 21P]|uniref:carboxypeptidase-like regulatory domain-containing protein n=1 Tax=Mucilaginibacter sp. 21P TaxID=2778902 RepID=UPI001C5A5375|nr:carboxypeptidase-like regulatory domain-containing protein [Mucilaginibacter sp. 21P]QXV65527.1 carboxypeptidase-like regulatory domain-containing protein [Mucilaginibacter sp. 21P]